ncbi:helix-turn-helix domain-containing protein [Mycobacterium sp. NPDC006124]|uniref:TetR/AcrR family transcriptional regulator n=1 Tax=Mycobacterium sp. NPDC006124 TaxID=3156729 RepID=UPI0033AC7CA1
MQTLSAGRHGLTPEEVAADQRRRIFAAMAEVMAANGYANTTVSDIVTRARVSRPTFYQFFDDKRDCFLAGYAHTQQAMINGILRAPLAGTPMQRFDELLQRYLSALAANPATSMVYLVHSYEAGPEAVSRRLEMQQRFVDGVAGIFKARSKADRFACTMLVGAISTVVTHALVEDRAEEIVTLRKPILNVAERLMARLIVR